MYVVSIYVLLKIHFSSPSVAVQLIKHQPVPGLASNDLLELFQKLLALLRHHTMPGRAPSCARTVAVEIGRFKF